MSALQHHDAIRTARTKLKLMVVEDDDHLREGLALLLESDGHAVVACSGAVKALHHLREGPPPDLIILDLVMPEMNGWQFRVETKREPSWSNIPIIALSGDLSAQAEAIDAAAYLSKPVADHVLLSTVERLGTQLQERRGVARASELQRLVSLGSLVGGIAHEINNPLAVVEGSLELLQRQLVTLIDPPRPPESLAVADSLLMLERVKLGTQRIATVVQCVSLFASADPTTSETLDIHDVLESSIQVASNELRHFAKLERSYREVPHVQGNPAKLGQVFLNLLLNAVFAIRESDQLDQTIRVTTAVDHQWVVVTVSDRASLIHRSHISAFDPLTSVTSGRLGLHFGLAVSREVIESMGGTLELTHGEPPGATFCVRIPGCTAKPYVAPVAPVAPKLFEPPVKKRPAIAVVDDDPLMCELLSATLSNRYDVAAFTSPLAALTSLVQGRFDLILSDVMMPELNGLELFEELSRRRPELSGRFIFITGGAFTERALVLLSRTDRPILKKPFARQQLLTVVNDTLLAAELNGQRVIES